MQSLLLLQSLPLTLSPKSTPIFKPTLSAKTLTLKCCTSDGDTNDPPPSLSGDAVSGMVDELLRREENRDLLNGLQEASRRVDRAREALADIERQEVEACRAKEYVSQLERRKLEIAESQRELTEARAMVDEAQRSLSSNMEGMGSEDALDEEIDKDEERLESVKAASISAVIGTLASLPISLYQDSSYTQLALHLAAASISAVIGTLASLPISLYQDSSYTQLALHLAIIFISCALFGVTFRYTVRRDLDNIQLKTGTSAAFGLVKGLATLGAGKPFELDMSSLISLSVDGAVYASQSIFIFLSASIALDFCFKTDLLSPFPMRKVR